MTIYCRNCGTYTEALSPRQLCGVCEYCQARAAEAQLAEAKKLLRRIKRLCRTAPSKSLPEGAVWKPSKRIRARTSDEKIVEITKLLETDNGT